MSRRVLTPSAAMEIKRLYALEDEAGNKLHSQMEIADMLGVSETTVFRAIKKRGAYRGVRELPTDQEARDSAARVAESLGIARLQQEAAPLKLAAEMLAELDGDRGDTLE